MVLRRRRRGGAFRPPLRSERGAQAVEFAMILPLVAAMLVLIGAVGFVAAEFVVAQGLARDAARTAAVAGVEEAAARTAAVARPRQVEVEFMPGDPRPGDIVTARVRLTSRALAAIGVEVTVPARASMRVEAP